MEFTFINYFLNGQTGVLAYGQYATKELTNEGER